MFVKMKESKGFTLVELMIVVAIIGILAAVAVPYYQRYIQKSRLVSKVFPGMHAIETNLGSYYSFQQVLPLTAATLDQLYTDASTQCFTPTASGGTALGSFKLTITIASATSCPELKALAGETLIATPSGGTSGKITGWALSGTLATNLGLEGEK